MAELQAYPVNVGYAVSKLEGYSRNTFRIESTGASVVTPGKVVVFNFPEDSLVDLKSFRWVINSAIGSYAAAAAPSQELRNVFPNGQGLIYRMEIRCNGIQITQGCIEYNTAYNMMKMSRTPTSKSSTIDNLLSNHVLDSTGNANFAAAQSIAMVISDWIGFLEAPSTRFIDTGLCGLLTVQLTLADASVMSIMTSDFTNAGVALTSVGAGPVADLAIAQGMTYTLSNFYGTIDCIGFNDGHYAKLVREQLEREEALYVNFDDYISFPTDGFAAGATSITTRFSLNSQSINKLYATMRKSSYNTLGQLPDPLTGTGDRAYQPAFYKMQSFATDNPPVNFKWQWNLNGIFHPQHLATEIEAAASLVHTENKVFLDSPGNQIFSFYDYRNSKFMCGIRLNHPIDGERKNAYVSGYDSRSMNSAITFACSGITVPTGGGSVYILANTTSTMRIGKGRQIQVVQ